MILRVAFVVLTFFGGVGLLLYVALWLLLPEDGSDWAKIKLDRRSRTVALVMVGALALLLLVQHGWWGGGGWLFVCLVVVAAAVVISTQLPHRGDGPPATYQGAVPPTTTSADRDDPAPVVRRARAAASGQPAQEGPDPVLVRARGDGRRPRRPRDRRPGRRRRRTVGVPGDWCSALSALFLLIGAFFGRAGGIILVGLLAAAVDRGG